MVASGLRDFHPKRGVNSVSDIATYKSFLAAIAKDPYDESAHRVFADWLEERGEDEESLFHRQWTKEKQEAWDFFKELAPKLSMTYDELMKCGDDIATGEFCFGEVDAPDWMNDKWHDFQKHWQTLNGKRDFPKETAFRCAC